MCPISIERIIPLTILAGDPVSQAKGYWVQRCFHIYNEAPDRFDARRGSWWGNLLSFDMRRLVTNLTVSAEEGHLRCRMRVKTYFRDITPWNREYWELEMREFGYYMTTGGSLYEEWTAFSAHEKQSNRKLAAQIIITSLIMTLVFAILRYAARFLF